VLPSSTYGYSYDAVGNRLSKTVGAATDTYTYSATSNQLASITPASGPVRDFQFDANGSTVNDAVNGYAYDARGRLVQATSSAGTSTFQVNALGQRVQNPGGHLKFLHPWPPKLLHPWQRDGGTLFGRIAFGNLNR